MKKILPLLLFCAFFIISKAHLVSIDSAKIVASNVFKEKFSETPGDIRVAYIRQTTWPEFYVLDINKGQGFVIVAAQTQVRPVLAYSNEAAFDPSAIPHTGLGDWMFKMSSTIDSVIVNHLAPDQLIHSEWDKYLHTIPMTNSRATTAGPLITTTWNQTYPYNSSCPGGSLTGCVATCQAQIMNYWHWPPIGEGSFCYNISPYGNLCANFGATTYNWANMPNAASSVNNDLATLNYHCGVSVAMQYSPSASGSLVLQGDAGAGRPCQEFSFLNYFRYNAVTLKGVRQASYSLSAWIGLISGEILASRPVSYAGWDPRGPGHSWICDGWDYDVRFHMNFGWGGYNNGWFMLDGIAPIPYLFNVRDQALIGIQPASAVNCNPVTAVNVSFTGTASLQVNWSDTGTAAFYRVRYQDTTDKVWNYISPSALVSNCIISNIYGGKVYRVEVQKVCSGGGAGQWVAANLISTPSCPVPVISNNFSSDVNSITVRWNNTGAVSYSLRVYKVNTPSVLLMEIYGINSSQFRVPGLAANTYYFFEVAATCQNSVSTYSAKNMYNTTQAPACPAPSSISASGRGDTAIVVSWTGTSLSYNLQMRDSLSSTWSTIAAAIPATSFTVKNILPCKSYQFQVQGICSLSNSAFISSAYVATNCPTCPVASVLPVTAIGTSSGTLHYSAPGASGYNIAYGTVGGSVIMLTTASDSVKLSNLNPNALYRYSVQAVCPYNNSTWSEYYFFTTAALPCPLPGKPVVSAITAGTALVSWTGAAPGTNIIYRDSSSARFDTIRNVPGNSYTLTGLNTCNSYLVAVAGECSINQSAYTSEVKFRTSGCPELPITYCPSKSKTSKEEYIKNVNIGGLNNTSGNNGGYGDFTALSTSFNILSSNTISVAPGFTSKAYNEYIAVFIDYNHNGTFSDPGELVCNGSSVAGATFSKSFTVSASALTGPARLRVIMDWGVVITNGCSNAYSYGETEDYTVVIGAPSGESLLNAVIPDENIVDQVFEPALDVYPNPASGNLITVSQNFSRDAIFELYSTHGQKVVRIDVREVVQIINLENIANGLYFARLYSAEGMLTRQLIIQR